MIRAVAVVVPAHDEELLLPDCLRAVRVALDALVVPGRLVVALDACTDRSTAAATVADRTVTVAARNVGVARAAGVDVALACRPGLDPAEVWLATTDADSRVPPGWLRGQVALADDGADAVVGTVLVRDWGRHPVAVRERYAARYGPVADGHRHVHGANLGVRASAYLSCGGFPPLPLGEDVALVEALVAAGHAVVRRGSEPVTTSARVRGRVRGGFADHLGDLSA